LQRQDKAGSVAEGETDRFGVNEAVDTVDGRGDLLRKSAFIRHGYWTAYSHGAGLTQVMTSEMKNSMAHLV